MTLLHNQEREILAVLSTDGGFTTGDVAKKVPRMLSSVNARMHSAAIRQWLLKLEGDGRVKKMDDQKPVCWALTNPPAA